MAPAARTSGRNPEAEKRPAEGSAKAEPAMSAGPQPAIKRVGVEERHGEVADVLGYKVYICATMAPMRASRPWLHRQALGAPEVPEVKRR